MSCLGPVFCHGVRGVPGTRRRRTSFNHFIGNTEVAGAQVHTPKGLYDWTQMQGNTGLLKGGLK